MKKRIVALICFASLLFSLAPAVAAPAKALSAASLDKFLKDYPALMGELEALGDDILDDFGIEDDGDESMAEGLDLGAIRAGLAAATADARVRAILKKYGWNELFTDAYIAIFYGLTYLTFEEIYAAYPMAEYKAYMDELKSLVHGDDVALVKANRGRIEDTLDFDD
jgi:hypothetical protein